tara:strand:- start:19 stop:429 length:411 start_codon:yes stop_codon:yes gene_type:complete
MQTIKHEDKILSIIYRDSDWVKGLNFVTPDELFIQVGSWWYDKGKKLDNHVHKEFDRNAVRTQESIYIKQGSVKVQLFSEEEVFLEEYILYQGDLAVFAYGGHGYEILEDNTQVIESKNGPFISVDKDKRKFGALK